MGSLSLSLSLFLSLFHSLSLSLSFILKDILKDTIFFRTYKMSQERGVICPDQKVVRLQNPGTWCYANASINFLFSSPVFVNYKRNCFKNPNRSPLIEQLHALLIQNNEDIGSIEAILKIVSKNNDPNTDFRSNSLC